MTRRSLGPLLVAGAALLGAAPAVLASTGVSVDVGRIAVDDQLAPGGAYRLPAFGIRNPGTEPTSYRLVVSATDGQAPAVPPPEWFTFEPAELSLAPGASRAVSTHLVVPPDAVPGDYAALIGPEIVAAGSGATVGAGAAVRLTFTIAEAGGLQGWLRLLGRVLAANSWAIALAGLLGILLAGRSLRGRFAISVTRRA